MTAFLDELRRINDEYNAARLNIDQSVYDSTAGDSRAKYWAALNKDTYISPEAATAEILGLLQANGYESADDLKQSVSGSHNDAYMDLGIGNSIYVDKSTGFNPTGGSARDVTFLEAKKANPTANTVGQYVGSEQGKDYGILDNQGLDIAAAALAPFTYGASTAALAGIRDVGGMTQDGDDWKKAATSVATNTLIPKLTDYLGDAALGGETLQTAAEEQAAFEAYQAAQQGTNIMDYAQQGLSNLPDALPFADVATGIPSLTDAARAAYEASTSGVINNLVSNGVDIATNGATAWDIGNQAYNFYEDIRDDRRDSQGVPYNQDQSTGGLLDDPGGSSAATTTPTASQSQPTESSDTGYRDWSVGSDNPQGGLLGDDEDETPPGWNLNVGDDGHNGFEFLGGDRWQEVDTGRVVTSPHHSPSGSGTTRVGQVYKFPEYSFGAEGDNTVESRLSLGGPSQQEPTLMEALQQYYANNQGQYQIDVANNQAVAQPATQPAPQPTPTAAPSSGLSLGGAPGGFTIADNLAAEGSPLAANLAAFYAASQATGGNTTGTDTNTGTGTGTGTGTDTGTGTGGNPPTTDTPDVTAGGGVTPTNDTPSVPLWDTLENGWESRIQRPDYGGVQMQGLLSEPQSGGLQAPMITPASNSNQASFAQWQEDYENGLLQSIASKQSKGLI